MFEGGNKFERGDGCVAYILGSMHHDGADIKYLWVMRNEGIIQILLDADLGIYRRAKS